jgi:hypothetical protein
MAKSLEISPMKSLAEELDFLRKTLRECLNAYAGRVESQLTEIRQRILEQTKNQKASTSHLSDVRDMISLCRTLELKPEKGRRKDLKKIESTVEELHTMVQNW